MGCGSLTTMKIREEQRDRGWCHFARSKTSRDWLEVHLSRIAAARIWKETLPDALIPCTVCGQRYAMIMNCPWNGTVCIEDCNICENDKGWCDYLG